MQFIHFYCLRFQSFSFINVRSSNINKMNSRRTWKPEQDKAITELVSLYGHKNWAQIAIELAKQFGPPQRSGKQCRQRWHNHLNPVIQKKSWSKAEEESMFTLHKIHGNKWTVIAESLPGRTDNSIKNYFYSTIRRSLRRMGKFVGSKNSTDQMKHIKPSTLSKIFGASSQLPLDQDAPSQQKKLIEYIRENCETVRDQIIKFTNYKPRRNDKAVEAEKMEYQRVIEKMVYINQIYEKIKYDEKRRRIQELTFQKDNGKLMLSDDSFDEESQEDDKDSFIPEKQINTRRQNRKDQVKVEENVYIKNVTQKPPTQQNQGSLKIQAQSEQNPFIIVPTVILKSKTDLPLLQLQTQQKIEQPEIPEFLVEIKQEDHIQTIHHINRCNFNIQSPGYFMNSPTHNPFCCFQSPVTPRPYDQNFRVLQGFRGLQNISIDEFQISAIELQKQIEQNLNKENKTHLSHNTSTIGTPLSAFSPCSFP